MFLKNKGCRFQLATTYDLHNKNPSFKLFLSFSGPHSINKPPAEDKFLSMKVVGCSIPGVGQCPTTLALEFLQQILIHLLGYSCHFLLGSYQLRTNQTRIIIDAVKQLKSKKHLLKVLLVHYIHGNLFYFTENNSPN